ncbi:hypothetical protein [Kitasatospora griseola]|uniref:hypothetical protein n=1 Tax=Kitasatospora griseola TaxID=2064 RepID=UPI00343CEC67
MGVLRLKDGRIVGYRVSGKDHPLTMANAQRARNVAYCVERFGRDSNFTAFELERFADETGMDPFGRITWWIIRGVVRYLREDPYGLQWAVTVTAAEAPVPKVKRPAARAADALTEAKKGHEQTRGIAEAADLAVHRGGGWALEGARRALGIEESKRITGELREHARQAKKAAATTESLFIKACNAADAAYMAARRLDVIRERWAYDRTTGLVDQVAQSAATAAELLHKAERCQQKLYSAAERWAARAR